MKEHRVRALRVTTTSSIRQRSGGGAALVATDGCPQVAQLRLELACCRVPLQGLHNRGAGTAEDQEEEDVLRQCAADITLEDFFKKPGADDELADIKPQQPVCGPLDGVRDAYERLYDALIAGEPAAGQLALQLAAAAPASGCPAAVGTLLGAAVRRLLRQSSFPLAAAVARMSAGALHSVGAGNLLATSVGYLDDAAELTRVLLHVGASVWGEVDGSDEAGRWHPQSPFGSFVVAVVRRRRLDGLRTLQLLSEAMADQPARMRSAVIATMLRHATCVKVLGPVFVQLKSRMERYWLQPLELRLLCRRAVRKAVGPRRLAQGGASRLGLPPALQRYVCLE